MWQQISQYLQNNTAAYFTAIWNHVFISVLALLAAAVIGVLAGFLCVRYRRSERYCLCLFQTLRVIPSLAVLLLLIPLLGTGLKPALTALILLAIPPILFNTIAGLENVAPFMLETARGSGMTDRQVWLKVRFPLAMPAIFTGLKIALIEIIASATLAAKIGAGGLGEIIFTGLGLNRFDLLLIGGLTVALLSISAGLLLELADRLLLRYQYIK